MDEMTEGHWIFVGLLGVAFLISLIKWYVKKTTEETFEKKEKEKRIIDNFRKEQQTERDKRKQEAIHYNENIIEIQKEGKKKSDETLSAFKPNWRPVYENIYDKGLKKLIETIDNLGDDERIKLIQGFRKSIEETIPNLGKRI